MKPWTWFVVGFVVAAVLVLFGPGREPVRQPVPTTVYVPAGPDVCREESDCRADWNGTRWVIIPGEDPQ